MYWHLQHLGWNHSGICESPVYYTQQWKHCSVLQSLTKKKHSQETGFTWKLQPWLVFPITPQNMPFAKGYYDDNAEPAVFSTESWVSAIHWRHYAFPEGQVLQMMVKRDLVNDTKSSMVTNKFLASECSEN